MKRLLLTIMLLPPIASHAQLSDDMLAILALDEPAKSEAIEARREQLEVALGRHETYYAFICNKSTESASERLVAITERVRGRITEEEMKDISVGEMIFFAECDHEKNAFELNWTSKVPLTDESDIWPSTIHMIVEMSELLLEKGRSGLTPIEYLQARIRAANAAENDELSIVYNMIVQLIEDRLEELETGQ